MNDKLHFQAWIFDHDKGAFRDYVYDRPIAELVDHTRQGETIVHRSRDDARHSWDEGDDVVIESGIVRPWPAGEVLEIAGVTCRHSDLY